jgi:hypothetical protein
MEETYILCRDCAVRLGTREVSRVPALLDGRCPQCAGITRMEIVRVSSFAEFPVADPAQRPAEEAA